MDTNALTEAFGMLTRQLLVIAGPLAVLGSILGNVASGFGLLMSAVRVLSTSLAPILLPVLVVLSAAIVAASEVIFRNLLPSLSNWYKFVLATLIPATLELADAFLKAADWILRNTVDTAQGAADLVEDTQHDLAVNMASIAEALGHVPEGTTAQLEKDRAESRARVAEKPERYAETRQAIDNFRGNLREFQSPEAGGGGQFGQAFGRAMDDVLQSFQMQIGPKAQTSGIAEAVKQAQMAALNQDPLEARQLQMMTQILQTIRQAWSEWKGERPAGSEAIYGAAVGGGLVGAIRSGMGGEFWGDF